MSMGGKGGAQFSESHAIDDQETLGAKERGRAAPSASHARGEGGVGVHVSVVKKKTLQKPPAGTRPPAAHLGDPQVPGLTSSIRCQLNARLARSPSVPGNKGGKGKEDFTGLRWPPLGRRVQKHVLSCSPTVTSACSPEACHVGRNRTYLAVRWGEGYAASSSKRPAGTRSVLTAEAPSSVVEASSAPSNSHTHTAGRRRARALGRLGPSSPPVSPNFRRHSRRCAGGNGGGPAL